MIFTEEQIKRLPGSTVRLADGRAGTITGLITSHKRFVEFQMYGGRKALANTHELIASSTIDIIEVLQWADEKQPEPEQVPNIDRHWKDWLNPSTATYTLEQLHDYHARIVEQLACEIYMQHIATMKKAARLGVK